MDKKFSKPQAELLSNMHAAQLVAFECIHIQSEFAYALVEKKTTTEREYMDIHICLELVLHMYADLT